VGSFTYDDKNSQDTTVTWSDSHDDIVEVNALVSSRIPTSRHSLSIPDTPSLSRQTSLSEISVNANNNNGTVDISTAERVKIIKDVFQIQYSHRNLYPVHDKSEEAAAEGNNSPSPGKAQNTGRKRPPILKRENIKQWVAQVKSNSTES
jgi:hypothetical protein